VHQAKAKIALRSEDAGGMDTFTVDGLRASLKSSSSVLANRQIAENT
jgi:hypothetical protein